MKKKIFNIILVFSILLSSVVGLNNKSFADGGNGDIKIYACVMDESNHPIKMKFYKKGSSEPFKVYTLDDSNDWKVEDSIPAGIYDVKASMEFFVNYKLEKYPFKKEIEVKEGQKASTLDDGAFSIVQADELYFDDYYRNFLGYTDANGNFKHGKFSVNDAKAVKEDELKRQGQGELEWEDARQKAEGGEGIKDLEKKQQEVAHYYDNKIADLKSNADADKDYNNIKNNSNVEKEPISNSNVENNSISSNDNINGDNIKAINEDSDEIPLYQKIALVLIDAILFGIISYFVMEKRKDYGKDKIALLIIVPALASSLLAKFGFDIFSVINLIASLASNSVAYFIIHKVNNKNRRGV